MSILTGRPPTALPLGSRLSQELDRALEARTPLLLTGPDGIGKSTFVLEEAGRRGLETVVLDLSRCKSPVELLGPPHEASGNLLDDRTRTLPRGGAGLLVLDKLASTSARMLAPLDELLSARTLGNYVLPEGWQIIASATPASSDDRTADHALRDRFRTIETYVENEDLMKTGDQHRTCDPLDISLRLRWVLHI